MKITVTEGRWYTADIKLNFVQKAASNDTVKGKLEAMGFKRVTVTGSGGRRTAKGKWMGRTTTVPMPSQVSNVQEIET